MRRALVVLLFLPSVVFAQEQQPADEVRLLIPIVINTAGALNTNWQSDLVIHNESSQFATMHVGTVAPLLFTFSIQPLTTAPFGYGPPAGNAAVFLHVPREFADRITVAIRVHDTTRDADSAGVEIPAIPETQFRRSVVLVGIPNDARFRKLLRIYSQSSSDGEAMVTLRDDVTGAFFATQTVDLRNGDDATPAYGQVALDPLIVPPDPSRKSPRVRVEITTTSADAPPIWAFATITNNTTQEVNAVTPATLTTGTAAAVLSSIPIGRWSGGGACVETTATKVTIVAGCSSITFVPPAILPNGHFEADGLWTVSIGPVLPNPPSGTPVHVSGFVESTSMTLRVTFPSDASTWTVKFGSTEPCGPLCV